MMNAPCLNRIAPASVRLALTFLCLLASSLLLAQVPRVAVEVVAEYPHDADAFTQGLVIHDGQLFESTGRYGQSSLRLVDLENGEILRRHNLARSYFAEGITVLGDRIYQLTWRSQLMFAYDRHSFELLETYFLAGEGWGLTDDGEHLIVSDGSPTLRFLDPDSGRELRRVDVRYNGTALRNLNELEYIRGEVWANVWYEDVIVRIDPDTGVVNSVLDLDHLDAGTTDAEAVLNGIAWDREEDRIFVTGKLWSTLYEITVSE